MLESVSLDSMVVFLSRRCLILGLYGLLQSKMSISWSVWILREDPALSSCQVLFQSLGRLLQCLVRFTKGQSNQILSQGNIGLRIKGQWYGMAVTPTVSVGHPTGTVVVVGSVSVVLPNRLGVALFCCRANQTTTSVHIASH